MHKQVKQFQLDGEPVSCEIYGSGHINKTFQVYDTNNRRYILQRINKNVFKEPEIVMRNILAVTSHIAAKTNNHREYLVLIPTKSGKMWLVDEDGQYWRMYEFVSDTICLDLIETPQDFEESGWAFGTFHKQLNDFPMDQLAETIPDFHNTPKRFEALKNAIEKNPQGRLAAVKEEVDFALAYEAYAGTLETLKNSGALPVRVTHNDTKLNNVLLDAESRKAICIIDLDTVMPGLSLYDFGDAIRFGASTALEDERDLTLVKFSIPLYKAFSRGFISACGDSLTEEEFVYLRDGAKMMTLECGVRFLTDYLLGDVYFGISRPEHNLDRCRTQFKLVAEMEQKWEEMQKVLEEVRSGC